MDYRISTNTPCVLAVGDVHGHQGVLDRIFTAWGWKLHHVRNRSEARAFLDGTPVGVVISDQELPEGGWREVLDDLQERLDPPALVVTSRLADESLWAEVLNKGGYDVLAEPLDSEEVTRVVSAAARHFVSEQQRREPQVATLFLKAAS